MSNQDTSIAALELGAVFVAGPFFKLIDPVTGRMPEAERALVEGLLEHFESAGARVFNAHRREKWGSETLPPEVFTRLDYDEIKASDLLVAMPGLPGSLGTHVELGWASAMGVPTVFLLEPGGDYHGMVSGMSGIVPTAIVKIVDKRIDFDELDRAAHDVMRRHRERGPRSSASGRGSAQLAKVESIGPLQVRRAFTELCPTTTILDVHPGPQSYSNRLWRLETDEGDFLLRIPGRTTDPEVQRRAIFGARLANDAGVPAPRCRAFAPRTAALGLPAVVQELTPGERVDPSTFDLAVLGATLGDWVGRLHAVRRDRFGAVTDRSETRDWGPIVLDQVRTYLDALPEAALPAKRSAIEKAFAPFASIEVEPASLNHGDLYLDNVLVRDGRVSCLLDFEHAVYRDRFADFGKLQELVFEAHPATKAPFLEAYHRHHAPHEDDAARMRLGLGLYALAQLHYFSLWQPSLIDFYQKRLGQWLVTP